jgi:hypothetical protein
VFEEICMGDEENRRKYGLKGGVYINGENVSKGPPLSFDEIKKKIEEKLTAITPEQPE